MESCKLELSTTLTQVKAEDLLIELDNGISVTIQKEQALERELTYADSYLSELEEKITIIEEFIRKPVTNPLPRHLILQL